MFKRKRNLRKFKHHTKTVGRVLFVIGVILFVGVVTGIGYYYFWWQQKGTTYISPLASVSGAATDAKQAFLEKALKEKHIVFQSVTSEDDTYLVKLGREQEVVFSAKKDIGIQISSLQFILSRLTMEDREFSRLDLRFDKPVITLEK